MKIYFNIVLLVVLTVSTSVASNLDYTKLENKYDHVISHFAGRESIQTTYYKLLLEEKTEKLSEDSKRQHLNILAVYKKPNNEQIKETFINDFPKDFNSFISIFHQSDFSQLYDNSHIYLSLLNDLSEEYPEKVVNLLLSLSKKAKYDSDAPNYLQDILTDFIINHYTIFIEPFKKMDKKDQINIAAFISDVESIATYEAYDSILELFRNNKEIDFIRIFSKAKEERIKRGH